MEKNVQVQRIAAKAIIVNAVGEVLLLREASTNPDGTNIGKYLLPGGRIELGERVLAALEREVLEETGLKVVVGQPVFVSEWFPVIRGVSTQIVGIFFACSSLTTEVTLSHEHDGFAWVSPSAVAGYAMTDNERQAIQQLGVAAQEAVHVQAWRSGSVKL